MPTIVATPPISAAQFRLDLPEFQDPALYSDNAVNYWLAVATLMLNADRWGTLLNFGVELFVAHNLVLGAKALDSSRAKGWPGMSKGAIAAESAGQVSVNYDSSNTLEGDGSHWNLTEYGVRFLHTARLFGAGPIQIGPCGGMGGVIPGWTQGIFGPWLF